ncbi:MAG: phosphatidate cytidylyltransferase [Armatimonadota bacterium]|nr:phosphatidate cytidylyltransferase [Armatimonadota bacterium]MDR7428039.1 phosphatidate cytidylyltransferase [Armatimonadota bacterium]MDR7464260.1 phosphatidate cytidylyltransferase [Armatimonadota bacterium]MDR7470681.1 phosphatidate cytidylyltransferase [Armatimonadota bacterium]MDR7474446.1 phosphatidate cytidylyltransferase [Armatimonadota bacterium]
MMVEVRPVAAGGTARRALTVALGIPLVLLPLYLGGWAWTALLVALALLGAREWIGLARASGLAPAASLVLGGTLLLYGCAVFRPQLLSGAGAGLAGAALAAQILPAGRPQAAANAGITLLGPVYLSLFAALDLLRRLPGGLAWTLLVVVSVWVADSAAYFGGRALGRHPLAPAISPAKTWEGAASGELGGVAAALVTAALAGLPLITAAAVGALAGTVGLLGDLAESALKRAAGLKDSGALLPGHGGVLDRFDAMLFVAPVVYALLVSVLR